MYLIKKTSQFDKWLLKLKDAKAKAKILVLIKKMEMGNLVDYKGIKSRLKEIRIHYGPGYRIYFVFERKEIILLLLGGIKSTQKTDIEKAKLILKEIED